MKKLLVALTFLAAITVAVPAHADICPPVPVGIGTSADDPALPI